MGNDSMKAVFITDENYAMPTAVAIASLLHNCRQKERLSVHVLLDGVSQKTVGRYEEFEAGYANIKLIRNIDYDSIIPENIDRVRNNHVSKSALLKFMLPSILSDIDKVLYLDGDILVNKDISELFQVDMGKNLVAAVSDMGRYENPEDYRKDMERAGTEGRGYFNSGVMLLDLDKMRQAETEKALCEHRKNADTKFMDQDSFNNVMHNDRYELPYKYNFFARLLETKTVAELNEILDSSYSTPDELLRAQSIIHYTGKYKAWKYDIPYETSLYMEYYKISPYKNEPIDLMPILIKKNEEYRELDRLYNQLYKRTEIFRALKKIFKH